MKTLDAVKIMDIARALIPMAMHAAIAILAIRFIRTYIGLCIWFVTISTGPFFICDYVRKRVMGRVIYRRKYAVFTINPDSGLGYPGNENQCIGIQRYSARSAKRQTTT